MSDQLIDLQKKVEISLEKKKLVDELAQISIVLDISTSMSNLYSNGTVQRAVERFLALGMKMDFDKKIDVFLFGVNAHEITPCTPSNFTNYVQNEILKKYRLENSTYYAPIMKKVVESYIGSFDDRKVLKPAEEPKRGFFARLFGLNETPVVRPSFEPKDPSLVFFITDGENFDEPETIRVINAASDKPIFWQYLGIGNSRFEFLRTLDEMEGRFIDNANFQQINDLNHISDEELYDRILSEYPSWLQLAREKGIVK